MYLAYPAQLPTAAADVPDAGVAIEMGGFVRLDGSTFRRQVVHYNKAGKVRQQTAGYAVPTLCSCAPVMHRWIEFLPGRQRSVLCCVGDGRACPYFRPEAVVRSSCRLTAWFMRSGIDMHHERIQVVHEIVEERTVCGRQHCHAGDVAHVNTDDDLGPSSSGEFCSATAGDSSVVI